MLSVTDNSRGRNGDRPHIGTPPPNSEARGSAKSALLAVSLSWHIARDHGFSSEERHSCVFRVRFDITRYQFCNMGRSKDAAALASQEERFGFTGLAIWIKQMIGSGLDRAR